MLHFCPHLKRYFVYLTPSFKGDIIIQVPFFVLYVLSVEITNQHAPSQTGEQNVKCRINDKNKRTNIYINVRSYLLKLSMFHSMPVHKSSQKVCRTPTALFMSFSSHMCADCPIWCKWWHISLTMDILKCRTESNQFGFLFCSELHITVGDPYSEMCLYIVEYVLHFV